MAVKRKYQKRQQSEASWKIAVKIKCCHCDLAGDCPYQANKERDENKGIITYCTKSPNKKNKKSASKKAPKKVITKKKKVKK